MRATVSRLTPGKPLLERPTQSAAEIQRNQNMSGVKGVQFTDRMRPLVGLKTMIEGWLTLHTASTLYV